MTDADIVWERACSPGSEKLHFAGDRALADMLLVHGLIMNGGVHHVVGALEVEDVAAGIAGYRYFKLDPLAALVTKVRDDPVIAPWTEANELEANRQYYELAPDDELLVSAFDRAFEERREDFDRVR